LDAVEIAVHHPGEVRWDRLPDRCVIQLHWMPTRRLVALFRETRVRTVSLARHPLDVLLSVLVFVQRGQDTAPWLPGTGDETALIGVTPYSPAFLRWAASPRAQALVGVTPAWWARPDVVKARYEHLLADPQRTLCHVLEALAMHPIRDVASAIRANPASRLHELSGGIHVWHATTGLYQEILTGELREALLDAHASAADTVGYSRQVDAAATPDALAGLAAWTRLRPRPPALPAQQSSSAEGHASGMVATHER
jgi:hypothetical protein